MTLAIAVEGLTIEVGDNSLLSGVDLQVESGSFLSLVGPNGAGKSTLLKAMLGSGLTPRTGRVLVGDQEIAGLGGRERAARVAWLPQHSRIEEPLTALELVGAARYRFDERRATTLEAAHEALDRVGVADVAHRSVPSLSGGECQRVELACLLAQEARVLLLDEPANHLDPANQIALYGLLGDLWRGGSTLVVITHDVSLLEHVGQGPKQLRVVGLEDSRIGFDMNREDDGLPGALSDLFGVVFERVSTSGGPRLVIQGGGQR